MGVLGVDPAHRRATWCCPGSRSLLVLDGDPVVLRARARAPAVACSTSTSATCSTSSAIALQVLFYSAPIVYPIPSCRRQARVAGVDVPLRSSTASTRSSRFVECLPRRCCTTCASRRSATSLYLIVWSVGAARGRAVGVPASSTAAWPRRCDGGRRRSSSRTSRRRSASTTSATSRLKAAVMRGRGPRYEEFWALDDVSFEMPQGATFGLIGENGSGKSTLLKCMARILRPERGAHPQRRARSRRCSSSAPASTPSCRGARTST